MADEQDIIGSASEFIKGKIHVKHGSGVCKYFASNKLLIRMTLAFIVGKHKLTQDSGIGFEPFDSWSDGHSTYILSLNMASFTHFLMWDPWCSGRVLDFESKGPGPGFDTLTI